MIKRNLSLPLALVLAAALSAAPVDAQKGNGNGNGNGNGKNKQEQRDERRGRDNDRRDDDRRVTRRSSNDNVRWESRSGDDRWSLSRDRRSLSRNGRRVPTGWCQGRGNPHNTAANCGGYRYNTSRSLWEWSGLGSYPSRTSSGSKTLGGILGGRTNSGSYGSSHESFHRSHDARCREAARSTSSVTRRLEIASACKNEHDDWHRRTGTRH